jgi:23S rRNA (pseudouridine1915-N3)-methyltransferase
MKIFVVAVGHKMPVWINTGFKEYAQRMPREARIELVEIKPATRGKSGSGGTDRSAEKWMAIEAERISTALPARCVKVVLDERGKACNTTELARRIESWRQDGGNVAFIIGGADGTAPDLQRDADLLLALSAFTLPHGLCRVMLAEQLYRAVSLLAGHPYHRE